MLYCLNGKQEVVYTIVASADNAIKEAVYMMKDKTVFVPMLENNPTTVKELKEGVKVHSTAEVKIVNAEGKEVTTGNIAEGMKLVVQAENGDQMNLQFLRKTVISGRLIMPDHSRVMSGLVR